jgi:hypothetical protein
MSSYRVIEYGPQAETVMPSLEQARADWEELVNECGSDTVSEENAILSIGRAFLPECAVVVLDGGEATVEYYLFLSQQTAQAQHEHDVEVAAGRLP